VPRGAGAAGPSFDQWIATFRAKALAHGITDETYTRVTTGLQPDTTGLEAIHNQPEFSLQLWQYLNRVTSD
jgi:membrane-bound lytic murein transglycosylase B